MNFDTFGAAWRELVKTILTEGGVVGPRGMKTKELEWL